LPDRGGRVERWVRSAGWNHATQAFAGTGTRTVAGLARSASWNHATQTFAGTGSSTVAGLVVARRSKAPDRELDPMEGWRMVWFLMCLGGIALGVWRVVVGWRARPVGYLQLTWKDGWLLRGRWISWRTRALGGVLVAAISVVAALLSPFPGASGDFVLTNPKGWTGAADAIRDGRTPPGWDMESARAAAASSAVFAFVADEDRLATYSVDLAKKTGAVTRADLSAFIDALTPLLEAKLGGPSTVDESGIIDIRGTSVGRHKMTLSTGDRKRVMLVFLLPGASSRAHIAYGADAADYEAHLPEVMAAVETAVVSAKLPLDLPFPPAYLVIAGFAAEAILVASRADSDDPRPTEPKRLKDGSAAEARKRKRRSRAKPSEEQPPNEEA
jgi:hypothetical protein